MSEFTPSNISDSYKDKKRRNYLGEYNPDSFWLEMGKTYLKTFTADPTIREGTDFKLNIRELVARIYHIRPQTVLEVGCGFGRCMPFVKIACKETVKKVVGIEFSKSMIEDSKLYLQNYPIKDDLEIIHANAKDLPFKDKEFDLTYTHCCLTHIPPCDIPRVTSEIGRVTKSWIVHVERFRYPYEHPNQHRWSHLLPPYYLDKGWELWDNDVVHEEHYTIVMVFRRLER